MQPAAEKPACWPALLSVIAAVHSSLAVGYAYGYTSTALEQLNDLPDGYAFRLGSISADLFVVIVPGSAFLSCLFWGVGSDKFGRKKTILLSGIPNAAGWILIAISPYVTPAGPIVFKGIILTGRLLTGVASSGIYAAVSLYAAEVALSQQRGFTGTFHPLFFMIGISVSYAVGAVKSLSYSQSAVIATGFVFMYIILTATLPESPRWLVVKGYKTRAVKVLQRLGRSCQSAHKEVAEMRNITENTPKLTWSKQLTKLCKKHVCLPLAILLLLAFLNQTCGQVVLNFYSSIILENAGVSNPEATAIYSIGLAQIFGIILSCVLVDRVGRKPLLILGGLGTGIACGLLGTHFYITRPSLCQSAGGGEITSIAIFGWNTTFNETTMVDSSCNPEYAPLAICSLVLFSLAYSMSYLSVISNFKTELTPLGVRGLVISIANVFAWLMIIAVTGSYYSYEQAVQPYTAWWSFAAVDFCGALFVLAFVPETKGRSLEDIEIMFRSKQICCNSTELQKDLELPDSVNCQETIV